MELISSPPMLSSRVSLVSKQLPRVRRGQGPVNLTYGSKDRYIILYGVKGEEESEVTGVPFEEGSKETTDFWEGEKWNFLGEISSLALPIFVVLAIFVGVFAAQTYNQDADVFLDSPKSDIDSAKLYKFE